MRQKQVHGFPTGDLVTAQVPGGKKTGIHKGRVAIRASGKFNIQTSQGVIQGIAHRHCKVTQRNNGYGYSLVAKMDVNSIPPQLSNFSSSARSLPCLKTVVPRAQ